MIQKSNISHAPGLKQSPSLPGSEVRTSLEIAEMLENEDMLIADALSAFLHFLLEPSFSHGICSYTLTRISPTYMPYIHEFKSIMKLGIDRPCSRPLSLSPNTSAPPFLSRPNVRRLPLAYGLDFGHLAPDPPIYTLTLSHSPQSLKAKGQNTNFLKCHTYFESGRFGK